MAVSIAPGGWAGGHPCNSEKINHCTSCKLQFNTCVFFKSKHNSTNDSIFKITNLSKLNFKKSSLSKVKFKNNETTKLQLTMGIAHIFCMAYKHGRPKKMQAFITHTRKLVSSVLMYAMRQTLRVSMLMPHVCL